MTAPRRRWSFGLRTLFVTVTALAVGIAATMAMRGRSAKFSRLAHDHEMKAASTDAAEIVYHSEMADKFRRASRYPWLPVQPDSPHPEPEDSPATQADRP